MKTQNNKIKWTIVITLILFTSSISFAQSKQKLAEIITNNKEAKREFLKTDFAMYKNFSEAYAYIIFSNVGKDTISIGGAAANGIAYEKGNIVGLVEMSHLNMGIQRGGQPYREIIFFESKKNFNKVKKNKVKLAAQLSAVAVSKGASINANYEEGILIFTMQEGGLMYEASVGGQELKFNTIKSIQ